MPTTQPRTMVTLKADVHERASKLARKEGIPLATWIARLVLQALIENAPSSKRRTPARSAGSPEGTGKERSVAAGAAQTDSGEQDEGVY